VKTKHQDAQALDLHPKKKSAMKKTLTGVENTIGRSQSLGNSSTGSLSSSSTASRRKRSSQKSSRGRSPGAHEEAEKKQPPGFAEKDRDPPIVDSSLLQDRIRNPGFHPSAQIAGINDEPSESRRISFQGPRRIGNLEPMSSMGSQVDPDGILLEPDLPPPPPPPQPPFAGGGSAMSVQQRAPESRQMASTGATGGIANWDQQPAGTWIPVTPPLGVRDHNAQSRDPSPVHRLNSAQHNEARQTPNVTFQFQDDQMKQGSKGMRDDDSLFEDIHIQPDVESASAGSMRSKHSGRSGTHSQTRTRARNKPIARSMSVSSRSMDSFQDTSIGGSMGELTSDVSLLDAASSSDSSDGDFGGRAGKSGFVPQDARVRRTSTERSSITVSQNYEEDNNNNTPIADNRSVDGSANRATGFRIRPSPKDVAHKVRTVDLSPTSSRGRSSFGQRSEEQQPENENYLPQQRNSAFGFDTEPTYDTPDQTTKVLRKHFSDEKGEHYLQQQPSRQGFHNEKWFNSNLSSQIGSYDDEHHTPFTSVREAVASQSRTPVRKDDHTNHSTSLGKVDEMDGHRPFTSVRETVASLTRDYEAIDDMTNQSASTGGKQGHIEVPKADLGQSSVRELNQEVFRKPGGDKKSNGHARDYWKSITALKTLGSFDSLSAINDPQRRARKSQEFIDRKKNTLEARQSALSREGQAETTMTKSRSQWSDENQNTGVRRTMSVDDKTQASLQSVSGRSVSSKAVSLQSASMLSEAVYAAKLGIGEDQRQHQERTPTRRRSNQSTELPNRRTVDASVAYEDQSPLGKDSNTQKAHASGWSCDDSLTSAGEAGDDAVQPQTFSRTHGRRSMPRSPLVLDTVSEEMPPGFSSPTLFSQDSADSNSTQFESVMGGPNFDASRACCSFTIGDLSWGLDWFRNNDC